MGNGPPPSSRSTRTAPGPALATRVLHLVLLIDVSGSMAPDGKIQSLNTAIEETLPHLRRVSAETPDFEVHVRVVAFASEATWVVEEPVPIDRFRWRTLQAVPGGLTETGAAIALASQGLHALAGTRSLSPGLVLVSDGMPTDTTRPSFADAVGRLDEDPVTAAAVRMAVGIGRDADDDVLRTFTGSRGPTPVQADNPQQLMVALRDAATSLVRTVSEPS